MKRILYITVCVSTVATLFSSCGSNPKNPGRIYMPDMAYSRAYETYIGRDTNKFTTAPEKRGGNMIFYNNMPPAGTIKRGEMGAYTIAHDSNGYKLSASVRNPLDSVKITDAQMKEAARLYDINCAICHGAKGGGNGPIADKIGAVANFTLPKYIEMADGTMFHSITYGLNNMGSYASQLSREQRWLMVKYIRTLQPSATATAAAAAPADTTKAK